MRIDTLLLADSWLKVDINVCYLGPTLGFVCANRSEITVIMR